MRAGEVVSTDRLIDGLWGGRPPASAGKVLQNAVSQLRRSLGDDLIVTRAPGYALHVEPEAIDAHRFEALLEEGRSRLAAGEAAGAAVTLRDALALWRGPALDEFAYEPFAEAEAARLEELRLRALEERIDADLALGRHADVVGELERLLAGQPLRERPRGQLMLAFYRSGRQAEALRTYQDGRRLLAEELGLEPGADLQQLEKHILTHDPVLDAPPTVPLPRQEHPRRAATGPAPRRPRRRLAVGLAAVSLGAVVLAAAVLLVRDDQPAAAVVPDSLVKIDPKSGEIVDVFDVGGEPFKPAVIGDYVFVSSEKDDTLSRIDVRSGEVATIGRLPSPAGVAAGPDETLWVGSFEGNRVRQIDAADFELSGVITLPKGSGPRFVAVGGGSVWVSHNPPAGVSRFSAETEEFQQLYAHSFTRGFQYSTEVSFGEGAAWTAANSLEQSGVLRVDAQGGGSQPFPVGELVFGVTAGLGAVWLTDLVDPPSPRGEPEVGRVLRLDPMTGDLEDVIPVGERPSGIATGAGSVWVANGGGTTVSQIDPRTNEVVRTIRTRYHPHYIAYGHGYLWVSLHREPFSF